MKLTLAQAETLKALDALGRRGSHSVNEVVSARQQVRTGSHRAHFEKHWDLLVTKTYGKLIELKDLGLVREFKGGWCITVNGQKAVKGM